MKSSVVLAAALAGTAQAGVHKMKLQKIPLEEQLVRAVGFTSGTQKGNARKTIF